MKSNLKHLTIALVLLPLLSGCYLKSLHPFYEEQDPHLVEGVEGVWQKDDQRWTIIHDPETYLEHSLQQKAASTSSKITFTLDDGDEIEVDEPVDDNRYLFLYEDLSVTQRDTVIFIGAFFTVSDHLFLDLTLLQTERQGMVAAHLIPVHTLSKVKLTSDRLSMEFFKDSWITELIKNKQVRISHEIMTTMVDEKEILLTAKAPELKKFIFKYADEKQAFRDPKVYVRIP